jgi:hypothetical protein
MCTPVAARVTPAVVRGAFPGSRGATTAARDHPHTMHPTIAARGEPEPVTAGVGPAVRAPRADARRGAPAWSRRPAAVDCALLALAVVLATALYVPQLGFYSDDWASLAALRMAPDTSFAGHYDAMCRGGAAVRPGQCLLVAGPYHLFGLAPAAFAAVNTALLAVGAVAFYLALRELGVARGAAVAAPLLYAMLPHYATVRFWMIASAATASIGLYFGSLYADLRAGRGGAPRARPAWWLAAAAAGVACTLTYEVFVPMLLVNPLVAWFHARRRGGRRAGQAGDWFRGPGGLAFLLARAALTIGPTMAWKLTVTDRVGAGGSWAQQLTWFRWMVGRATEVAFVDLGLALPRVVWRLARYHPNGTAAVAGVVAGVLAALFLAVLARRSPAAVPSPRSAAQLIAAGAVTFGLGYSIFVGTNNSFVTATGIGNRVAVAAAAGVAVLWVGLAALPGVWLESANARATAFATLVGSAFGACVFINTTLAGFWIEAYARERAVIAAVKREFPSPPGATAVLVDGICPYVGPAIVFEAPWDLSGAMAIEYGRLPRPPFDVVAPSTVVGDTAVTTSLYSGILHADYPYGRLIIFNVAAGVRRAIPDPAAARDYFARYNPTKSSGCPTGEPGAGVAIF